MNPEIARYIHDHRDTYTREAVRRNLVSAGYEPSEIDATWDAIEAGEPLGGSSSHLIAGGSEDSEGPPPPGSKASFIGYVVTIYSVAFLVGVVLGDMAESFGGHDWGPITILYTLALIAGALISIALVRRSSSLGIGLISATLIALLVPFVILVIISGVCVTVGRRYA